MEPRPELPEPQDQLLLIAESLSGDLGLRVQAVIGTPSRSHLVFYGPNPTPGEEYLQLFTLPVEYRLINSSGYREWKLIAGTHGAKFLPLDTLQTISQYITVWYESDDRFE